MNPKLEPIVSMLKTNGFLINNCLKDIKNEDTGKRPNNSGNSQLFLVGHITASRFSIFKLLGIEKQFPWPEIFSRGVEVTVNTEYPDISEVLKLYNETTDEIIPALENASDEVLNAKCPFELPVGDGTILGAMGFFAFHETYHVGQMAYLRRLLGYSQLVG